MNKLGVWSTCDQEHAKVISLRTKTVFDPASKTAQLISGYPHFWHYTMIVYCRNQQGEEYIVTGEPELPDENGIALSARRLDQAHLAKSLNDAHHAFLKEVNPLHIVNTGWIAFPYKAAIDEQTICEIADAQGVWGFLSKWEGQVKAAKEKRKEEISDLESVKTKALPELGSKE